MTVLVVDIDGVWLWSADLGRRLVVDGAVGSAIPDRVGGIVYQHVETGVWRSDWEGAPPYTAQWKWVGTGSAQQIRRLLRPGGTSKILVEAPPDGILRLVDPAIIGGHPTLAYLRTRHFTITTPDENPWWDSRTAELVVHDLITGTERVVRTQRIGWEYDARAPSFGEDVVAEAVRGYGEGNRIELLAFAGTSIDVLDQLSDCQFSSDLVADIGPTGDQLVYTRRPPFVSGQNDHAIDVTVVDHRSGSEEMRTQLSLPGDVTVVSLDFVDGRALAVTGSSRPLLTSAYPERHRGDRNPWVIILQLRLSQLNWTGASDTYLAPDGAFGPLTDAAVRAFQTDARLEVTGTVDAVTWEQPIAGSIYGGPQLHDPTVNDAPTAPAPSHRWH